MFEGLKLEIGDELKLPGTSAHYTLEQHGTRLTVKDDNGTLANTIMSVRAPAARAVRFTRSMVISRPSSVVKTGDMD